MRLYAAIDLHSNNSVIVILDENDQMIVQKKLPNDYAQIRAVFAPYQATLEGIAVESTYNWYWLVDSLMADGYSVLGQYGGREAL